jgi:T5SS/PEP-CTERM-associated repeat protein
MEKTILRVMLAGLCPAFSAFAQNIVTHNLVVHYASDTSDNNNWEELAGVFPGLDRTGVNRTTGQSALPVLVPFAPGLDGIDSYYAFLQDNNGEMVMHLGIVDAADSYQDILGDAFNDRNTSFEIWFRPNDTNSPRQVLWETGGGTGASFTLDNTSLEWRTRSNNQVASVQSNLVDEITGGLWIQAVGTIDFNLNTVELFVNGVSAGTSTASGNINDWDGGDGDGIGGRGGSNLGGFGGGWNYNGGNYGDVDGEIAIFRIYQDITAAAAAGALLTPAEIQQNYDAYTPARFFFVNAGLDNTWGDGANWSGGLVPTGFSDVFIGGTHTARVDTNVPATLASITLGHNEGTADGIGTLQVDAGELYVDRNVRIGSNGANGFLTINNGLVDVGNNLVYGVEGNNGGDVNLFGGTLRISGDIRERATAVTAAQLYVDGGTLQVGGDSIVVQSFRTGNQAGRSGTYTLSGGKRLDNTGTFFVGRLGAGTFTIEDASLYLSTGGNDLRIAAESASSSGVLNLDHPEALLEVLSNEDIEIGLLGQGTMNVFDGRVNAGRTQFGRSGGGGVLNIQGGLFVARNRIITGASAQAATINLSGGVLDLSTAVSAHDIRALTMQGDGALLYRADSSGFTPLNVISNATITGGRIALLDPPPATFSTADKATWTGGVDTWDLDDAKWLNDLGSPGIPAIASGIIATGAVFDVLTTEGLVSGAHLLSSQPGWELFSPNTATVSVRRLGARFDGGPAVAVIDDPAAVLTRAQDLQIYRAVGSDASRLDMLDGALTIAPGSELVLGGTISGDYNHHGGLAEMETLRFGTGITGFGGTVNLRGGTLHVTGDIIEHSPSVNTAQVYIDGGTLVVDGDITVQSFRTGNGGGSTGAYVQTNGQVILNTGTFVVGYSGDGTHFLDDGEIIVKNNLRIGEGASGSGVLNIGRPGTSPFLRVGSDNLGASDAALDIGRRSPGTLNLRSGTVVSESDVLFGQSGVAGGGLLHISGGRFSALREVNVVNASTAMIHLEGGELELLGDSSPREIIDFAHSNAVLRVGMTDALGGSIPLTVISNGLFGAGAMIDLAGSQAGLANTASNAVRWVGGNGSWDSDTNDWLNAQGVAYLPANGQDFVQTGSVYSVITGAQLIDTNLVQSASPGLELVVTGGDTLGLRVLAGGLGGLPVPAVFDAPGSAISRLGSLTISPEAGADAAELVISNGVLNVSGDLGLGGTQYAFMEQSGGDVTVDGDLLFGPTYSAIRGGTLNLNDGSLTVRAIREIEENIDTAQVHWNGGILQVSESITVQRFSVAEFMATNTVELSIPITTTGDFTIGGLSNAVGHLTLSGSNLVHRPRRVKLGQTANAHGTLVVKNGSMIIGPGEVDIAGDNSGDGATEGHFSIGSDSEDGPYISSTGSNVEIGRAGRGMMTLKSGLFEQLGSNLVLGQYAGASGTFNLEGGTYRLTNPASDFNMNAATGVVNQTGGVLEVADMLNMGNTAGSLFTYNLDGGLLTIGRNLDYRNNGSDTFNLNGGSLVFTNGSGTIYASRTGVNAFNFSAGVLSNCGRFEGSLDHQGGILDIGASVGLMTVTGDYTGSSNSTLKLEIDWDPSSGAAQPGVDFDQLVVHGNTDLSSLNLDVSVLNPAISNAVVGTVFTVIDGASPLAGSISGPAIIDAGGTPFFVYHGDDLVLVLFTNDLGKDTDSDGVPDLQELAFGTDPADTGTGPEGLPKIVRVDGGTVRVTYRQVSAPIIPLGYVITSTTDLSQVPGQWPMVSTGQASSPQPPGLPAGVVQMEAEFTVDPDEVRYYRVRVDLN